MTKFSNPVCFVFTTLLFISTPSPASNTHPTELEYTIGKSQSDLSGVFNRSNPAGADFRRGLLRSNDHVELIFPNNVAIEYGNVDDLFIKIDELSSSFTDSDGSDGGNPGNGDDSDNDLDFDVENPDLEALISQVEREIARVVGITALIATEGYAKAELKQEISLLFNKTVFDGTFKLDFSRHAFSSAIGLAENVNFDPDIALAEIERLYDLGPSDPVTQYDLSGGIILTVDPAQNSVHLNIANDSLLLTKAAQTTDISLNFSRLWTETEMGALYWGVTPKYREIGLTNIAIRLGDLTDSEELFEQIENATLKRDSNFVLDAGLLWISKSYSLGATFKDLNETTYSFPAIDLTRFNSEDIVNQLERERHYKSKTQLTLEGSAYTREGRWAISAYLDTNTVLDPLRQAFQWMSVRGDVFVNKWYFSNAHFGAHTNLAGSELTYFSLGADFLKYLCLDISTTRDTTTLDGDKLPRGFAFTLGLNARF